MMKQDKRRRDKGDRFCHEARQPVQEEGCEHDLCRQETYNKSRA